MSGPIPSSQPAQWPPNSYEDRSTLAYCVVALLSTVCTVAVGLRMWTRAMIGQTGIDDWAAFCSLLLIYACGISVTQMTRYGLGRHGWVLSPESLILYQRARHPPSAKLANGVTGKGKKKKAKLTRDAQAFWVSLLFYVAALAAIKLTFLTQYYRIMSASRMRNVYMAAMVVVASWGVGQVVFACVACTPLNGFWDPRVQARCIPNAHVAWYIGAMYNILSDVVILLLPIPVIRRLNLPGSQRAFLLGIFSLGFLTVAISVLRIKWLTLLSDPTWSNLDPTMWSLAELTSAITCACLATLRPLATRLGNWRRGRRSCPEVAAAAAAVSMQAASPAGDTQKEPPQTSSTVTDEAQGAPSSNVTEASHVVRSVYVDGSRASGVNDV